MNENKSIYSITIAIFSLSNKNCSLLLVSLLVQVNEVVRPKVRFAIQQEKRKKN